MASLSTASPLSDRAAIASLSRIRSGVCLLAGLAVAALAWAFLAPVAVGGPTSYVVTDGVSMLPRFHANGLVITHSESNYSVGEVVAYHNQQLHTVVMHRIVARDGNRYIFKGDNNGFRDSYHPTKAELVGEEWIYWPGAGRYLTFLRSPLTFAIVIAVVALISFRPESESRRQRRRRHARH